MPKSDDQFAYVKVSNPWLNFKEAGRVLKVFGRLYSGLFGEDASFSYYQFEKRGETLLKRIPSGLSESDFWVELSDFVSLFDHATFLPPPIHVFKWIAAGGERVGGVPHPFKRC